MEAAAVRREFQQFLLDLTSVEKKTIHALTDVARDILATRPLGAPMVAAVITDRVLQAPVSLKLPTLYLLDSIVKLVGEPYTSYFAGQLPEAFAATWHAGDANLQRALQKLYATWAGVFPQHVLTEVATRIAQLPAAPSAAPIYYPAAAPVQQQYGYATMQPAGPSAGYTYLPPQELAPQQPAVVYVQQAPVAVPPGYAAQSLLAQQPPLDYGVQTGPASAYAQQPAAQPAPTQPAAPVDVANLMASLVNAGILAAAPPAAQGSAAQPLAAAGGPGDSIPPAAATPLRPEEPVSMEFTPERIKDKNPAAVARLLEQTERTKGRFLDRKFLRRQRRSGSVRSSRLWYVDLDTWMASSVGAAPAGVAAVAQQEAVATAAAVELCTVPVDDSQTHCALSGERFQQFWDEQHQEWRYRDAKALDAEEAARYGLQEGALVLVSALGAPAANLLQPVGGGVLATLAAEQEIAADLAAATAAGVAAGAALGQAGDEEAKDTKLVAGVKHEREEAGLGEAAAGGSEHLEQKRLRVH